MKGKRGWRGWHPIQEIPTRKGTCPVEGEMINLVFLGRLDGSLVSKVVNGGRREK